MWMYTHMIIVGELTKRGGNFGLHLITLYYTYISIIGDILGFTSSVLRRVVW